MENENTPNYEIGLKSPTISYKIIIAIGLVIISIFINLYAFMKPGPLVGIINEVVFQKNNTRVYFNTGLDNFLKAKVPKGNLFLKFKGYGQLDKESDADIPLMIYMRAYYTLYPRQTFVVKPGIVVNKGQDIIKNPFNPDTQWLKENGVSKVVTIIKNPMNGNTEFDIHNVE